MPYFNTEDGTDFLAALTVPETNILYNSCLYIAKRFNWLVGTLPVHYSYCIMYEYMPAIGSHAAKACIPVIEDPDTVPSSLDPDPIQHNSPYCVIQNLIFFR